MRFHLNPNQRRAETTKQPGEVNRHFGSLSSRSDGAAGGGRKTTVALACPFIFRPTVQSQNRKPGQKRLRPGFHVQNGPTYEIRTILCPWTTPVGNHFKGAAPQADGPVK